MVAGGASALLILIASITSRTAHTVRTMPEREGANRATQTLLCRLLGLLRRGGPRDVRELAGNGIFPAPTSA
jgi:hypothetical protein